MIKQLPLEEIFHQLSTYDLPSDIYTFEIQTANIASPEEFIKKLGLDLSHPATDLIFELWRRICPDKPSLALFCHELDHQIEEYRQNGPGPETPDHLASLQYLLDENVDAGVKPRTALKVVQGHLKNDVESFLYHLIYDEIDSGQAAYAKELLEGFDRYVEEKAWFEYLSIRCQILSEPTEGYERLEEFTKRKKEGHNLELLLEVLSFLALSGNHSQFSTLALHILSLVRVEKDFVELLDLTSSHYRYLSLYPISLSVDEILKKRRAFTPETPVEDYDPALQELRKILEQRLAL